MAEERMRVLDMVREGKITAEEGARLLEALNAATARPQAPRSSRVDDPVGSIVDTITEAISARDWRGFGKMWKEAWHTGTLAGLERRRRREAEGWELLAFSEGDRGTFELPDGARLIVESEAGGIDLVAGEGPARLDLDGEGAHDFGVYVARKGETVIVAAHKTAHEARMPRLVVTVPHHVAHVEAHTASGGIVAGGFRRPVTLRTAGGGIRVKEQGEGAVEARTAGGGIEVEGTPTSVTLHTAGGGIRFGGQTDALDAKTAGGSITIDGARLTSGEHHAKTAGGSVHVQLTPDSSVEIDAATGAGSIAVDLPGAEGEFGGTRFAPKYRGRYHGGAARLALRTVGGGIHVGLTKAEDGQRAAPPSDEAAA
ncbi:MAG: hypothetical protein HY332_18205 [Chloroflexi bacterium]|nr:hypothetical protein [Chloroflexota bacterium]